MTSKCEGVKSKIRPTLPSGFCISCGRFDQTSDPTTVFWIVPPARHDGIEFVCSMRLPPSPPLAAMPTSPAVPASNGPASDKGADGGLSFHLNASRSASSSNS